MPILIMIVVASNAWVYALFHCGHQREIVLHPILFHSGHSGQVQVSIDIDLADAALGTAVEVVITGTRTTVEHQRRVCGSADSGRASKLISGIALAL